MPIPNVRVESDGHVIPVSQGESFIEAAWRQGYDWPTTCYGRARRLACRMGVTGDAVVHRRGVRGSERTTAERTKESR